MVIYMHAKFEVFSFKCSRDTEGVPKFKKVGHVTPSRPRWPNFAFFWRMAPVVNLSVKHDANIFIGDRYIAILLFRRFGCEVPIPAHFGEVFLGRRVDP